MIASFESRGIYAYDMNGKLLWEEDLGDKTMRNEFGEGSSPALYKDKLFVVWDHQGESFIAALEQDDRQGSVARRSGKRSTAGRLRSWSSMPGKAQVDYRRDERKVIAATTPRPAHMCGRPPA